MRSLRKQCSAAAESASALSAEAPKAEKPAVAAERKSVRKPPSKLQAQPVQIQKAFEPQANRMFLVGNLVGIGLAIVPTAESDESDRWR
jgi:hypothetical protein